MPLALCVALFFTKNDNTPSLNILLRTSVTGRLEIVLIDYGTCGPDQIQGDDKCKSYAGTHTHLPYYRLSDQDTQRITTQTYCSIGIGNLTNASHCISRPLRTSGNADDLFALGQCCIS